MTTEIGEAGWGLILSAGAVGLLVTTVVMLRVPLQRPLLWGMLGCALFGLPMLVLGLHPSAGRRDGRDLHRRGGIEVFSLGWSLAMQEHIPDEMLSRAYSYDALGSFIAIPVGQLAVGPLGAAFGVQRRAAGLRGRLRGHLPGHAGVALGARPPAGRAVPAADVR